MSYSIKLFKINGTNRFEKNVPPPYLLRFRICRRLALNCCIVDTEDELGDGVGQTHVVGANRGDDTMCFSLQWILTLKGKGNLVFLCSMRISLGENYLKRLGKKLRAIPSAGSLRERQGKPRLNTSNSRR